VEGVSDGRNQGIRVLRSQAAEDREQREVGHHICEELHMLDLSGHHRLCDACAGEHANALTELAELHPVAGRAAELRGQGLDLRERLALDRHDGHLVAELPGGAQHEKGERSVARNQPDRHRYSGSAKSSTRLDGRRRMTPRCAEVMKLTR
jgi:hypothetical protein